MLGGGTQVVLLHDSPNGTDGTVWMQRYMPTGSLAAGNVELFGGDARWHQAAGAALDGGGFVVVAKHREINKNDKGTIWFRRFAEDGSALGGAFMAHEEDDWSRDSAVVAARDGGGFLVAWVSNGQDSFSEGVYARFFAASGTPLGDGFRVNDTVTSRERHPRALRMAGGRTAVFWHVPGEIALRIYGSDGAVVAGPIHLQPADFVGASYGVGTLGTGFGLHWKTTVLEGPYGSFQRFDQDGVAVPPVLGAGVGSPDALVELGDSGFILAGVSGWVGSPAVLTLRRFDAAGDVAVERTVKSGSISWRSRLAAMADGNLLLGWSATEVDSDGSAALAIRLDPKTLKPVYYAP